MKSTLGSFILIIAAVIVAACGGAYRQSDKDSAGRRLVANKCSTCHVAPANDEMSPGAWADFLPGHGKNAGLDDRQLAEVLSYLQGGK